MAKKKNSHRTKWKKFFKVSKKNRKSFNLTLILILAILLFLAYGFYSRLTIIDTQPPKVSQDNRDISVLYFINSIGEDARSISEDNDLYASVMIAQAILESNHGTSELGSAPNYNLFGIKGNYKGSSATFQTWEDDGKGNTYKINAAFRKYPSYRESLEDYADILSKNLYADARKSNTSSYQEATQALTGRYATDTSYNAKLNHLIKIYHLTDYDYPINPYKPGQVYNVYRMAYTDVSTLKTDNTWAKSQLGK